MGFRTAPAFWHSREHAADGSVVKRSLRTRFAEPWRRRDRDRGNRRRSAGGALRADVPPPWYVEEHVRHRLLPAAEHRDDADPIETAARDHRRVAVERTDRVRARRQR